MPTSFNCSSCKSASVFISSRRPPNKALKLTRLSACRFGGPGSAEKAAAHWPCTQSAVQLSAGVGQTVEDES